MDECSEWMSANKKDYTTLKSYKLIALLNIMGKIFELVIARRLSKFTEINSLLPKI
jgi:hypothetical protein